MENKMENKWKEKPEFDWLLNLDQYSIEVSPIMQSNYGPWYSQDGEDGVIEYLFKYINDLNKFAIDLGSMHGRKASNVRHIVDANNWNSIEIDSTLYKDKHPRVTIAKITKDNLMNLVSTAPKSFDLLSLDIDSMDYYILNELLSNDYRPSVAIIEYNPIFSIDESYVIKYNSNYVKDSSSNYGASLGAFDKLFKSFGYTMIHIFPPRSRNAIFIKNDYIDNETAISNLIFEPWLEPWKSKSGTQNLSNVRNSVFQNFIEI